MNNIERFNSGDKRLQVVVEGMSNEQKTLVQKGFFSLGWSWVFGGEEIKHLDKYGYTTTTYPDERVDSYMMCFDEYAVCAYPTTSFTELMILADMHTQEDVIPYLNEDELIKYGIKQEEGMNGNTNSITEFTKDMLKEGMFVLLRNQGSEFSKGYFIVLSKGFVTREGHLRIEDYNDNLIHEVDHDFDVVEVFTSENVTSLDEVALEDLTSIWKRPSPEEVQRLSEKAALQEDIHAMKERLKSMESKLESM